MTVNHPQFGTMCCICFHQLAANPGETFTMSDGRVVEVRVCVVDADGQKWDVCKGECARQAGIVEQ